MPFKNNLVIEAQDDGRRFRLVQPLIYQTPGGIGFQVPVGFVTDFASVPRGLWNLIPPWGPYTRAAVLHDYQYWLGDLSRKEADRIFLVAMEGLGVGWVKRQAIYWGVRAGGWYAWNGHRKQKKGLLDR